MASVWLITGCSSGFGEQFVRQLTERGERVIATARNVQKIQQLKSTGAALMQLDVLASQKELDQKVEEALKIYGQIDIFVSNAGYVGVGTLEELCNESYLKMFSTTVLGPSNLLRSLLPHFRSRKAGTIIFNGSMWGWEGHAGNTMYCSAKFALEGLAEGLKKELAHLNVKVLILEPGFFRTSILTPENLQLGSAHLEDYKEVNDGLKQVLIGSNGQQPGDPVRGVKIVIDVVKGEGVAKGRNMPFRLPMGSDAIDCMKAKCEDTLKVLNEWDRVIKGSDFPKGQ